MQRLFLNTKKLFLGVVEFSILSKKIDKFQKIQIFKGQHNRTFGLYSRVSIIHAQVSTNQNAASSFIPSQRHIHMLWNEVVQKCIHGLKKFLLLFISIPPILQISHCLNMHKLYFSCKLYQNTLTIRSWYNIMSVKAYFWKALV